MTWALHNAPDWHAAAQSLVDGCSTLDSNEQRVRLMERLCVNLGSELYPAFLNILCMVGEFGDQETQILVAETLVHQQLSVSFFSHLFAKYFTGEIEKLVLTRKKLTRKCKIKQWDKDKYR